MDGGKTWNPQPELDPAALYIGGALAKGAHAGVVSEPLAVYYSNTPNWNFTLATVLPDGSFTTQNCESFSGTSFGCAGGDPDATPGEGVIVSDSLGEIFQFYGAKPFKTMSRYAAFPSDTTWYLSGGEWPRQQLGPNVVVEKSSRLHVTRDPTTGAHRYVFTPSSAPYLEEPEIGSWKAQIVKTTDGGATWTSVYYDEDRFYFNQIGCGSENHCCAVGEANNSTENGIRILCTTDGGATWKQNLFIADPSYSIMALDFLSDTEIFAAGGQLADEITGYYWHSTDGGVTWDNSMTIDGAFGNCMTFPSSVHGFSTAVTEEQQCALVEYK